MTSIAKKVRIGSGAGYSGDRIEPAVELAEKGNIQYLVFECLAERTIALDQQSKQKNPELGYDPLLGDRMIACLPACKRNGIKIITNMGAANPLSAMKKTAEIAKQLGIKGLNIAAVTGDDVLDLISNQDPEIIETGERLSAYKDQIVSANAYLGVKPIAEALQNGADIILTGRVSDPALFMAPLIYEFQWPLTDYDLLGKGTVLGHLLECAGQVTGGYYADPGYKEVPMIARLGFPIAEAASDGSFIITKVPDAGGLVTTDTCKEQLLYEIGDPANYICPDTIADFTQVTLKQEGKDRVFVDGGRGREKTGLYKVSIGYHDHYTGEGQISYGGPGALNRAKLALEIVKQRFKDTGIIYDEARFDLIGMNALYGDKIPTGDPYEVRVRVTARTSTMKEAIKIGNEVETLYTNGPAGGGGVTKSAKEIIAIKSVLIDSELVKPTVHYTTI